MKKLVALLLVVALCLSAGVLAACSPANPNEGTYNIVVWVSELDGVKELTAKQIDAFEAANPGIIINATIEGVSEGESATQMVTSVEDGADIFCFAQDQLARLVLAGALNKLGQETSKTVTELNDAGAVAAASVGGSLYCYPMTSDNGYFMFYDKSVISADHVDSLEDIIADCEKAGKMFSFELEGSAWYNAAFFFGAGCESSWTTDVGGAFTAVNDTYNSDKGLIAMKGIQKLVKSTCYNNSSAHADFSAAIPSAVVISGSWGTSIAKAALGDNFACADLPSYTVDGQSYHLGSFSGNKLLGVKPQTDVKRTAVLQQLALYLTSQECQQQRFTEFGWGPSNKACQDTEEVKNDVALSALAAQGVYGVPQGQIHGSWWDIAKVLATSAKNATTDKELTDALVLYKTTIDGLFSMSDEVKNAFTVIGSVNGDTWSVDLPMTKQADGSWLTNEAYTMDAGVEFKVRQGLSWDVAYGKDNGNFVVETAGTYKIKLTVTGESGVVELVPAN